MIEMTFEEATVESLEDAAVIMRSELVIVTCRTYCSAGKSLPELPGTLHWSLRPRSFGSRSRVKSNLKNSRRESRKRRVGWTPT